ncbi:helix-turn-helix domain-containing protein [Paractinoplanes atraurantiacus]|uniref:helix-turn-helix domain-containing protein n=1 Tax=Paractinoplanes atraurantiacus TaxID=1036182 RepID=UPI000BE3704C|nr:helix-turn-helix domain-containing protein [Actinoplanes atraurantiacus]
MENRERRRDESVHKLAAELGISDLEKFLRACLANSAMMTGLTSSPAPAQKLKYTVDEAAKLLGVSSRWLADECRTERVEHVHLARRRSFTHSQLLALLKRHEVEPLDRRVDGELERIKRRVARDRAIPAHRRG